MNKLKEMLIENFGDIKLLNFYPYTSIVTNRLMETYWMNDSRTEHDEFLKEFGSKIETKLAEEHPNVRWDNKVVVEFSIGWLPKGNDSFQRNSSLFLGWKDNSWVLGLGMYQPDSWTHECNIKLSE